MVGATSELEAAPGAFGSRVVSEFLACALSGFLLFATQANALLPGTKGTGTVGFPWLAVSSGLATFFPILIFGVISSDLNPSMMCAKWLLGRTGVLEALAMSITQVAGWGAGAILMVVVYFQHFATVPMPAKPYGNDVFRKSVGPVAQQIASVATPTSSGLNQAMLSPWSFLRQRHAHMDEETRRSEALMQRCETLAEEVVEHHMQPADVSQVAAELEIARQSGDLEEPLIRRDDSAHSQLSPFLPEAEAGGTDDIDYKRIAHKIECEYEQAVHADQLVKLNVFVTTPAIPSFVFNALQEFLGTVLLLVGALLLSERGTGSEADVQAAGSAYIGVWVTLITLAFGGPTGPSVNTARDLGPRLVHWIVPIPGKGPSNWWYAPLIAVSNIAGGAMAALLYSLITSLQ